MKGEINYPKLFVIGFFGLGAIALVFKNFAPDPTAKPVNLVLPVFTVEASEGRDLFAGNCATCHGDNASGSKTGPPLIHDIYNPGHHPDESFYAATANGVRQHHWPYGNMPRIDNLEKNDIAKIIQYVRELQVANGIKTRPHKM